MPEMQFDKGINPIDCYSDICKGANPEDELMIWHMRFAKIKLIHEGDLP
jgi:hypothetical protein